MTLKIKLLKAVQLNKLLINKSVQCRNQTEHRGQQKHRH